MKTKGILIILATMLFSIAVLAGGYQEAKWGMSPEEVKAAFPKTTFRVWGGNIKKAWYLKSYETINEVKIEKTFYFDKIELKLKLYKVTLEKPLGWVDPGPPFWEYIKQIRLGLHNKYGKPSACSYTSDDVNTAILSCMDDNGFIKYGDVLIDLNTRIINGRTEYHEQWIMDDTLITLVAKMSAKNGWWHPFLIYQDINKKDEPASPNLNNQL